MYTDEEIIIVNAIGHPPCERRAQTRYCRRYCLILSFELIFYPRTLYGHIDFLGRGATSVLEDVRYLSSKIILLMMSIEAGTARRTTGGAYTVNIFCFV